MARYFALVIGYSSDEPNVGNQSFMSRFAGGLIGILLATINTVIRSALIMSVAAFLAPFIFLSSLVSLFLYFRTQKNHNIISSFLFSLFISVLMMYQIVMLALYSFYSIIASPFIGYYYGKQDGFLQTLKNFGNSVSNQPFVMLKIIKNIINKIVSLYKFVTLDNNTFKNLMHTHNHNLRRIIHEYLRSIDNEASDNSIEEIINIFSFLNVENISILKIILTYFAVNLVEPHLPKKVNLELEADEVERFTVSKEILEQDFSSNSDLTKLIKKLQSEECGIDYDIPTNENKILLFKQYKNDDNQWVTVPAHSWVFNRQTFDRWHSLSKINPVNRDDLYNPPKYNNRETRYKICKVHSDNGGLVCQELADKVREFNRPIPTNVGTDTSTITQRTGQTSYGLFGSLFNDLRNKEEVKNTEVSTLMPGL